MINKLNKMLNNSGYNIIELEEGVKVFFGNTNTYPEDCILLKRQGNSFGVYELHRDERKEIVKDVEESNAILVATILCKKMFEPINKELDITRNLRKIVEDGNIGDANRLLEQNLTHDLFSISVEDRNKVCLCRNGELVNVKFHGKNIVENVKLTRGYVVLYNFTKKLMKFKSLYIQLENEFGTINEKECLEDLYIFGTLNNKK